MMDAENIIKKIVDEISKVIVGKRDIIKTLMIALLSGGHVLIEDVPGVGKTTLANALGKVTGMVCRRAQFTPDVMSSDITGFTMYNKENNSFEYKPGLVMCNILLADEINRTSPKTQSALLEAMEEHNVSVDGITYKLPEPFMVIATQNEIGYVGTFPLPEAQLDRFIMKISIGYPTLEQEMNIIASRQIADPIENVSPVCDAEDIMQCIDVVKNINVDQSVCRYIAGLNAATREHPSVQLGASPRASIALMRTAQSYAFMCGRKYVVPEDIVRMYPFVISHRLLLKQNARMKGISVGSIVRDVMKSVKAPFYGGKE